MKLERSIPPATVSFSVRIQSASCGTQNRRDAFPCEQANELVVTIAVLVRGDAPIPLSNTEKTIPSGVTAMPLMLTGTE